MKITFLGTGNAAVTEYYNTCFAMREDKDVFLVDAGGGNTILGRLKKAGIGLGDIRDIFVTHKHIDHILGIIWLVRMIAQQLESGKITGSVNIYGHDEVIELLYDICGKLLQKKQTKHIGVDILLQTVNDGDSAEILGRKVSFFDIHSTKAKQFGFAMELGEGKTLCCCGDEPLNEANEAYARGCTWLLHEAFCLESEKDKYKPYEKAHTTVMSACMTAERMGAENLVLYHSEDSRPKTRKEVYTAEGKPFYTGKLYVPDDMESIELDI